MLFIGCQYHSLDRVRRRFVKSQNIAKIIFKNDFSLTMYTATLIKKAYKVKVYIYIVKVYIKRYIYGYIRASQLIDKFALTSTMAILTLYFDK